MVSYAVLHHSVSASLMVLYVIFLLFTAIMVVCQVPGTLVPRGVVASM